METGCICSSLGPCKEHSPDFDVCECGDYRRDHEDGSGYCRMPNNLCHAFKECLTFRISQRADGLPIHPDTTTINTLIAERTEARAEAYREKERADALAKRVEELEDVLGAWGEAELALREETRRFVNDEPSDARGAIERKRPFRDAALALGVKIAERRAGRKE